MENLMVIARKDGIIFVTLADGEFLPENLNSEKTVVFRLGVSSDRQLRMIKELGYKASADLLKPPDEPICNYNGDGNPLHQHTDGGWWHYDESWSYEKGPFGCYEEGWDALIEYCAEIERQKESLTIEPESETIESDDKPNEAPDSLYRD
jgi:hypothetical protein